MKVAILTFEGYNELDSFVALGLLNRLKPSGWEVRLCCPQAEVTSMNGVTLHAQAPLEYANSADVVLFGSGIFTRDIARSPDILGRLQLDPARQLIGAQCSGTLLLAKLQLIPSLTGCTDTTTRPWVEEAGIAVLEKPLHIDGNVATAGGCLASQYLAAWVMLRTAGLEAATQALHYVAPVGEKQQYTQRVLDVVMKEAGL
ncbi:AraC family transcriptional regulator [Pokkaliibacter plantistimulans]|uniref:AraC family transcriptional regulator n=1 Tax=Proteobacteria bacterium 228 TaxID=2083153 RepID=A0A2S5KMM6_9PROT|nr:DJ-1/PfpI family protein [Pokkaliibacter plantistimulans]PPC75913.1 AraC family transcriptional regulator [Pokkaliibacter plantistimulans]